MSKIRQNHFFRPNKLIIQVINVIFRVANIDIPNMSNQLKLSSEFSK